MNCKQGDLAIVIKDESGLNAGKVCRCLKFHPVFTAIFVDGSSTVHNVWEVEPAMPSWRGDLTPYALDQCLRPIRDPGEDERDETLRPLPLDYVVKNGCFGLTEEEKERLGRPEEKVS